MFTEMQCDIKIGHEYIYKITHSAKKDLRNAREKVLT